MHRLARAVGPVYELAGVMRQTGWSQAEIETRILDGQLLVLTTQDNHVVYLAWQFVERDVARGLQPLLEIFREKSSDWWMVAAWLRAPNTSLDGAVPALNLDSAAVKTLARQTAVRWAN